MNQVAGEPGSREPLVNQVAGEDQVAGEAQVAGEDQVAGEPGSL